MTNIGCDQGCGVNSNDGVAVCQCNPGYTLATDNATCQGLKHTYIHVHKCKQ